MNFLTYMRYRADLIRVILKDELEKLINKKL